MTACVEIERSHSLHHCIGTFALALRFFPLEYGWVSFHLHDVGGMFSEILTTGMLAFGGLSRGWNSEHFVIERVQFQIVLAHA